MRRWSASEMPIPRSCTERIARSLRGLTRIVTGSPAVLQGVREEVRDDLVEAGPVPPPLGGLRLEDEGAPGPPRLVVEAVHHLAGDLREVVDRFHDEARSEEHTSELQSHHDLVCRL